MSCSNECEYFIPRALLRLASGTEMVTWSLGSLVAIVFVGVDVWRAFKKKQHWIPCDSFLLGALTLQLLTLLNMPSSNLKFPQDDSDTEYNPPDFMECSELASRRMLILGARVSVCVVMGCMLPGVARPRSSNTSLWSDMAALIIFSSLPIFHLLNEIYILGVSYVSINWKGGMYVPDGLYTVQFINEILETWIVTVVILLSIVILVLLLSCASLAGISIQTTVSRKIPVLLCRSPLAPSYSQVLWEKVEEQVFKSWIVVRTSNSQYIIARSVLSSSVALVTIVCNGILVIAIVRTHFTVTIPLILHCLVVITGSTIIYSRWITAVVYCPRNIEARWSSLRKYFEIEDFWIRYLVELKNGYKSHREIGDSYMKKLVLKLYQRLRLHKMVPLLVWVQKFLVLFSKGCWLLSQLLLSNMYLRKLLMGSAWEEFPDSYGRKGQREIQVGKSSCFDKYSKAFISMRGENAAGLWLANRKSIEGIQRQMKSGEEEGKACDDLIALLKNKSSQGFRGLKCVDRRNYVPIRLEVESEMDICKQSSKMTAISIITVIIELSSFAQDVNDVIHKVNTAIEACSQTWSIMDLVENCDREALLLSEAADNLFENLRKKRKLLRYHLAMGIPLDKSDKSSKAAKEAFENLVDKGKKIAEAYRTRTWNEVLAGYSLWRLCVDMDYQEFNKVEGIIDELLTELADVIGTCTTKAVEVIMAESEKWATMAEEEHIWKAAYVAGKMKGVTEKVGWMLTCTTKTADIDNGGSPGSTKRSGIPALRKHATFQIR